MSEPATTAPPLSERPRREPLPLRRPLWVLVLSALVLAASVPLLLRLRLHAEVVDLLPASEPAARELARYVRVFAGGETLVVLIEGNDPAGLRRFADAYATRLTTSPLVASVRHRVRPENGLELLRRHLFSLLEKTELEVVDARTTPEGARLAAGRLRRLLVTPAGSLYARVATRDPLDLLPLLVGRLRDRSAVDARSGYFQSPDGRSLLLFVRPAGRPYDIDFDRRLDGEVQALAVDAAAVVGMSLLPAPTAEAEGGTGQRSAATAPPPAATIRVRLTGAYAHALSWADWLRRDLSTSTTVSFVAVLLLFALFFRSWRILPFVALPLGMTAVLTLALAVPVLGHLSAVSLAAAAILLGIGIDVPIQLYARLREEQRLASPAVAGRQALERTLRALSWPSVVATLGPALVLAACACSSFRGLRELGVLAALGLCLNLGTMLLTFPALLAVAPPSWWAPGPAPAGGGGRWLERWGRLVARRPRAILIFALAIAAATLPASLQLRIGERLTSLEPAAMPPVATERAIEAAFGGGRSRLVAMVRGRDHQEALQRNDTLHAALAALDPREGVAGVHTLAALLPSVATQRTRLARLAALGPAQRADNLRQALRDTGLRDDPFEPFFASLATAPRAAPLRLDDLRRSDLDFLLPLHLRQAPDGDWLAATYITLAPRAEQRAVARAVRQAAERAGVQVEVTGHRLVEESLGYRLGGDLLRLSAVSAGLVLLLLLVYYRRLRPLLAVLLPLCVAWSLFAALLPLLGLPLNLFNLIAVPLVIGYGIDDHIFIVQRHAEDPAAGVPRALRLAGHAVALTSLSTIAGFAALALARFDGLRLLGISGGLAVGLCFAAAFVVLPALLVLLSPTGRR